MTAIDEIKNECRAIIAQAEKATPGPWKLWGMSVLHDPTGNGSVTKDCFRVASTGYSDGDGRPRTNDAEFIASSRSFTPRAAKALLDLITYVEEDLAYPPLNLRAREKLKTLCRNWEESK